MADNVTANPGTGGATFATDDVGGVQYPRSKLVWGVDGVATDASASDPLPVTLPGAQVTTLTPPAAITGYATAANQTTELTSLASIDGKTTVINTGAIAFAAPQHVIFDNASLAVTGTFYQVTQPVSGTFWQVTQPVSIAAMPSTPVTGTFWQATQPVSATALPLPSGAATDALQTSGNASLTTIAAKDFATAAKQDTQTTALGLLATAAAQTSGNASLTSIAAEDFSTETTLALLYAVLNRAQAATGTGVTGPLVQGLVSDAPMAPIDGLLAPLSITNEGCLRVSVIPGLTDIPFFDEDTAPSYIGDPAYTGSPWASSFW